MQGRGGGVPVADTAELRGASVLPVSPLPPSRRRTLGESLQMLPVMTQTALTAAQNGGGAHGN